MNHMNRVILITGATDGLGRALATELAGGGHTILVHGRSPERAEATAQHIAETSGHVPQVYLADLSSLAEVRRLADQVVADHNRLDVLVNNAGVGGLGARALTRDGHELRFGVNYLATFALTVSLLPLLGRSGPARVVNVASIGQAPLDFDNLMLERDYDPWGAYMQSKLAQILFTVELAERLGPESQITVNALHPGTLMPTKMVREAGLQPATALEHGVEVTARLCIAPEIDGITGRYFDGLRERRAHAQAYDPEARRRLWEVSEALCAVTLPQTASMPRPRE